VYLNKTKTERTQNALIRNTRVSQGSVATRLRCGENFSNIIIPNSLHIVPVEEFRKLRNI